MKLLLLIKEKRLCYNIHNRFVKFKRKGRKAQKGVYMKLYQKALFIDNDANTEKLLSFDELKTELKKRILKNNNSMFYNECMKNLDVCKDVIELDNKVVNFMDDDIYIKYIQPTPKELIDDCGGKYPVVYVDSKTLEVVTDLTKIDMDAPVKQYDINSNEECDTTLYIYVDANIPSDYFTNYNSLDEAKTNVDKNVHFIMECVCNECSRTFYTMWRSKYSPAPRCEECQDPLFTTVKNIISIDD